MSFRVCAESSRVSRIVRRRKHGGLAAPSCVGDLHILPKKAAALVIASEDAVHAVCTAYASM
jgi:hypothetical protein